MSTHLSKPSLHVEVQVQSSTSGWPPLDAVRDEVRRWLCETFIYLSLKEDITNYDHLSHASIIDAIRVTGFSGIGPDESFKISDNHLHVHAYVLHDEYDTLPSMAPTDLAGGNTEESEEDSLIRSWPLPNANLTYLWTSLYYEDQVPDKLLHYTTRRMAMMLQANRHQSFLSWRRVMLLHGPPGSGKTTLCRALAQKLAIRLDSNFSSAKLLEVNTQALHSKWFGESGRSIEKLFKQIHNIADSEDTLVCVLIDEVETIAGSREKVVLSNDVGDALRATNSLLTGLDSLCSKFNVMFFCTSNLVSTVDNAFLDRVGINQFIDNPTTDAAYEILRTCLNEMIRCGILLRPRALPSDSSEINLQNADIFPPVGQVELYLFSEPDAPGSKLLAMAEQCCGLSGRTLADLPCSALAMFTDHDSCLVLDGLDALRLAIIAEVGTLSNIS